MPPGEFSIDLGGAINAIDKSPTNLTIAAAGRDGIHQN